MSDRSKQSSSRCAHCQQKFLNSDHSRKKRELLGNESILTYINLQRIRANLKLINEDQSVCTKCFLDARYDVRTYTGDLELDFIEAYHNAEAEMTTQDPDEAHTCSDDEGLHVEETHQLPSLNEARATTLPQGINKTSHELQPKPDNVIECVCCFMTLENVPAKWKLADVELIFFLMNGESLVSGGAILDPFQFICDDCYTKRLIKYHRMWRQLPGAVGFKSLQIPVAEPLPGPSMDLQKKTFQETAPKSNKRDHLDECMESQDELELEEQTQSSSSTSENDDDDLDYYESERRTPRDDQRILLPIKSIQVTGRLCCVCGRGDMRNRIGKKCRMSIFKTLGIFISHENRMCDKHLDSDRPSGITEFSERRIINQQIYLEFLFDSRSILEIIDFLRQQVLWYERHYGRLSFKHYDNYSDTDFSVLLGVTKEQFQNLLEICTVGIRDTVGRSKQDALAMFLLKLKINPSHAALACFFDLKVPQVSVTLKKIRKVLINEFVPLHLGYAHLDRQTYIQDHTSAISKNITGATDTQAICVIDGTYLYIQKSSNYKLQRRTYSMHKGRNLLKEMMIVSTRGYILAVEGPYYGDGENNDSGILRNMMKDRGGFRSFFNDGDFVIEDRGFRDSNTLLTSLGYSVRMPHFLGRRSQHPTSEANESRLVTKIRWIVEAVNGRLKNVFRFFMDVIPNSYIKENRAHEMFLVASALLNAFHPPILKDSDNDAWLSEQMLLRSDLHNLLHSRLQEENYLRMTVQWRKLEIGSLQQFPRLTMVELRELTFGVYQLKQAPSYFADTIQDDGSFDIFYHDDLSLAAVRFKIQSRHRKGKTHDVFIGYNKLGRGAKSITGWYCRCANGSRVVGCCAHIASVIWYLSYARYCRQIMSPAANLDELVRDARTFTYENEYLDVPSYEEEKIAEQVAQANGEGLIESEDSDSDE